MLISPKISKAPFWNNVKIVPYLYILPNMILFGVFMILPIFINAYLSLTKWNGLGSPKFVGLKNYARIFTDDVFLISLVNTFKFTLFTVPLLLVLALLFAILLNQKIWFRGFFRSALYLPAIISSVVVGMVFIWMFDPRIGLINYMLSLMGMQGIEWLSDTRFSMLMIVAGTVWSRVGYNMVIYLAGLQGISAEYYEAATIDGASAWQKFRYVTMPLLKNTHTFILITCIIYSFRSFDLIYVMTKGGPLNSTKTLVMYIYDEAFGSSRFGPSAAAGVVLFLMLLVFTIIKMKTEKEDA